MNLLAVLDLRLAAREFNSKREKFYEDLAEAILDNETTKDFLQSRREFALDNGKKDQARIFERMLDRMDEEEGRFSHMFKTIVPDEDLLSLSAIESLTKKKERVRELKFLASTIRDGRKMKSTVVKAMMTPIIVAPIICAFAYIISVFFIPEYEKIAPPSQWPSIGKLLYGLSVILRGFGIYILAGAIGCLVMFVRSFSRWNGSIRARFDQYLPYSLYRDYQGAKFLVAVASLVSAKLTLAESLEQLERRATPWMAWHIRTILSNMDVHPDDYARAFNTGILSPEIHMRLSSYAKRSSFSDGLVRIGTDGLHHVQDTVEKSSAKMNILAIFVTVFAIMFFYGGNLMISSAIQKIMRQQESSVRN